MQSIARLGLIAALLVSFGWLLWRDAGVTEALAVELLWTDETNAATADLEETLHTAEIGSLPRQHTGREVIEAATESSAEESSAKESSAEESSAKEKTFTFTGILSQPDGRSIRSLDVRASMTGQDSFQATYQGWSVNRIKFEDVPHGVYQLVVQVEGYRHRPELLDLTITPVDQEQIYHDVILWPASWIAIVIRTHDGLPFRALADDLEFEAKELFVDAFRVAAAYEAFPAGAPFPPSANELARFRPPPGYQNVELPGAVAGSLELAAAPPLCVGLWVHGLYHDDQLLQATDTEIVFEIDMDVIDAGLARVSAQLVDRDSGAAVLNARCTLKADTSAHRRGDLSEVLPNDTGRLVFERVIPGKHELTILREGHIVQRRLTLSPGEDLDLGEIPIGSGPGLPIRVVDATGQAVQAWIEIAPLEPGSYVGELYPPNLHRRTDRNGHFVLPVPDCVSVVRARLNMMPGPHRGNPEPATRNMLVDPDHLPAELVLIAGERITLRIEPLTTWIDGHRVSFEDEHGLVINYSWRGSGGEFSTSLVPGPYVVRRWEGEHELGSFNVVVTPETRSVRCP